MQLWAEDESRLGLKPVTRRVWAPVGRRPKARFERGYEWTYLYGFVRPQSGEVFWMILPTVTTELFSLALREFAKEVGAGENKRIVLVVDKAGWHTGGEVKIPEGIELEFLPNGSPELMPAERLWPLTNEALANGLFEQIAQIEEALVARCVELHDQPEAIRDLTNYHWWPQRHDVPVYYSPGFGINALFGARAQRNSFRRYLEGLLLPAERNKTLTALANTEPVAGAQRKEAQSLQ